MTSTATAQAPRRRQRPALAAASLSTVTADTARGVRARALLRDLVSHASTRRGRRADGPDVVQRALWAQLREVLGGRAREPRSMQ
jgi:hypothetical protein